LKLAIFDLDNTLLGGDSDYLWGQFMCKHGIVERAVFEQENRKFYQQYQDGSLDIHAFLAFQLRPLAQYDTAFLSAQHAEYLRDTIRPIMLPKAHALLQEHRAMGHTLLIMTSTNRFITAPIATAFGVENLLATDPEFIDGRFTGRVEGVPCFREGKVTRLEDWLKRNGLDMRESWFYSDSHNDLPLLEKVTHPVAVDPDETLARHARASRWPIISLR
jgi:HAD superfamily hydrolase (TIGR01490 family)